MKIFFGKKKVFGLTLITLTLVIALSVVLHGCGNGVTPQIIFTGGIG